MVEPLEKVMMGVWLLVCCMRSACACIASLSRLGSKRGMCSPVVLVSSSAIWAVCLRRWSKSGVRGRVEESGGGGGVEMLGSGVTMSEVGSVVGGRVVSSAF